jgi:hypothetical protein
VPLSFRVRPALKAKMEQAVAVDGRTLMSEIESRIEWSFDHLERLGGERVARLLEGMAAAAAAKAGVDWMDDPDRFVAVEELWTGMMVAARPVVRDAPRVARPEADKAPPRRDAELIEQLLRTLDQLNRLLAQMLVEKGAPAPCELKLAEES